MKIIVCSLAINEWYRNIVKYALKNFKDYSNLHNYECVIYTEENENFYDSKRAPTWYKIKLIEKLLKEKDCDYILWIDADCQIMKHDVKLEYFIEKYFTDNIDVVLTQDSGIFCAGLMFIKKSDFTINLMDKIWNYPVDDYFRDFHEQSAFEELYKNNENIQKHVKIIPYGTKDELVVYWGNYYPDKNFIVHSARCSENQLGFMYMMDMWYKFKMEEESEEDYKIRFEYITNPEVCIPHLQKSLRGEYTPRRYSARCKKVFNF